MRGRADSARSRIQIAFLLLLVIALIPLRTLLTIMDVQPRPDGHSNDKRTVAVLVLDFQNEVSSEC